MDRPDHRPLDAFDESLGLAAGKLDEVEAGGIRDVVHFVRALVGEHAHDERPPARRRLLDGVGPDAEPGAGGDIAARRAVELRLAAPASGALPSAPATMS